MQCTYQMTALVLGGHLPFLFCASLQATTGELRPQTNAPACKLSFEHFFGFSLHILGVACRVSSRGGAGRKLPPLKTYVSPLFLLEQSEGNITKMKNPNYLYIISPIGFMFSNGSQLWPTRPHSAC